MALPKWGGVVQALPADASDQVRSKRWPFQPAPAFSPHAHQSPSEHRPPPSQKCCHRREARFGRDGRRLARKCWMVHSDVGCSVTFQCTIRREPISMTTKTHRTRKVAATETKQSQATIALEWLRTKVLHLWLEVPRGPTAFRYLRTVRGEIRGPT
jgi:hypothetical protein